jgi:hypothetical protein
VTGLDVLPDVLLTFARVGVLALVVAAPTYLLTDYITARDSKTRTERTDR